MPWNDGLGSQGIPRQLTGIQQSKLLKDFEQTHFSLEPKKGKNFGLFKLVPKVSKQFLSCRRFVWTPSDATIYVRCRQRWQVNSYKASLAKLGKGKPFNSACTALTCQLYGQEKPRSFQNGDSSASVLDSGDSTAFLLCLLLVRFQPVQLILSQKRLTPSVLWLCKSRNVLIAVLQRSAMSISALWVACR